MWSCIQTLHLPVLWSNADLRVKKKTTVAQKKQIFIAQWGEEELRTEHVQQSLALLVLLSLPECCCMWSNLLSQSTFTCTSLPTSRGELTKCTASGPCRVTLRTGTSLISPWSSGYRKTNKPPISIISSIIILILHSSCFLRPSIQSDTNNFEISNV